jgi:hypothetical protein
VVQAIKAGHPVCCHIQWESSGAAGGHFNAIVGYDAGSRDVVVADPESSYGVCTVPYDAFLANYHGGSWDQTCLTR